MRKFCRHILVKVIELYGDLRRTAGIGTRKTFSKLLRTLVASSVACHSWNKVQNDIL